MQIAVDFFFFFLATKRIRRVVAAVVIKWCVIVSRSSEFIESGAAIRLGMQYWTQLGFK